MPVTTVRMLASWLSSVSRALRFGVLNSPCMACGASLDSSLPASKQTAIAQDFCKACAASLPLLRGGCERCGEANPALDAAGLCPACVRKKPLVQTLRAAFHYSAPIADLIIQFKHHGDLAAGRTLARCTAEQAVNWPRPLLLVPVPLHPLRLRERGFDQAHLLAQDIGRALHMPVQDALQRTRATPSQAGLSAAQRRVNVRGAFHCAALAHPHIALIDDVATTGSTLNACALACRRAGALRVDAWVAARA